MSQSYASAGVEDPSHGTYEDWTPAYTNITVGDGDVVSRFVELPGGFIAVHYELAFGSSTTIDGTGPTISTPVTAASHYTDNQNWIGGSMIVDTGTSFFTGIVRFSTVDRFEILALDTSQAHVRGAELSATVPMTFADGDFLSFGARFERA